MQVISVKKKISVFHVDKVSLCYLIHTVIHKHDFNNICYPLLQPFRWVPTFSFILFTPSPYLIRDLSSLFCLKCTPYSVQPSIYLQFLFAYNGPTNQNNQLWLGGSKLHSKLWFVSCIISCFVIELKYDPWNEISSSYSQLSGSYCITFFIIFATWINNKNSFSFTFSFL